MIQVNKTRCAAGPGTVQALVTLDSCLYSQAVSAMSSLHQLQHEIVALTFQLSWPVVRIVQAERSYAILAAEEGELPPHSRFDTTSGRAESVDGSDSEEDESYLCAGLRPSATMASKQIREPQDPVHQVRECEVRSASKLTCHGTECSHLP